MLQHITSWSYRHRWLVVGAWVAVLVSVNLAGSMFGGESKQEFLSPGTDSKAAVALLDERFPDRAGDTVTVVVHDDEGVGSEDVRSVAEPVVDRFRALPHVVDVVSPWDAAGAGQVSADGTTAYAVVQLDTTGARFPVDVAS
jgi:RND superfamily putative drug exporter